MTWLSYRVRRWWCLRVVYPHAFHEGTRWCLFCNREVAVRIAQNRDAWWHVTCGYWTSGLDEARYRNL